jgi:DNA polymerase-3 subunit beta
VYRILAESEDEALNISINDNQILFKFNDEISLTSRLVEGQYPDYQQIIPQQSRTQAKTKTTELARVVKSASLFCKPGINDVKLSFNPEKSEITVSSVNSAVGENKVVVAAETTGENNEVV